MPLLFEDLWKAARRRNHKEFFASCQQTDPGLFQLVPSSNTHLRIEDKRGHLLAYRFGIPAPILDTLNTTEHLILACKVTAHSRGTNINRNWGL
jgi:hypothetical protein